MRRRQYLFEETGEFRCPKKGEWYISRSGGMKQATATLNGVDRWIILRKVGVGNLKVESVEEPEKEADAEYQALLRRAFEEHKESIRRFGEALLRVPFPSGSGGTTVGLRDLMFREPSPAPSSLRSEDVLPLKPCPFCGAVPVANSWQFVIQCPSTSRQCLVRPRVEADNNSQARAAWNQRTP